MMVELKDGHFSQRGLNYDEKIDIWAIGVITFNMLCGQSPFVGNSN